MADFDIKDPPVFSDKVRKFETTDKAHADLFNAVVEVLINNDEFLKKVMDDYDQRHKTDKEIHITGEERATWNGKAPNKAVTQIEQGLMSAADKKKLDGIAEGANKYSHPTDHSGVTAAFNQATTRANIASKENLATIFGKIMKFFTDVITKNIAFMTVVNNGTTTVANTLLDGRMGKTLLDKINSLNSKMSGRANMAIGYWSSELNINALAASGIAIIGTSHLYIFHIVGNNGSKRIMYKEIYSNESTMVQSPMSFNESQKTLTIRTPNGNDNTITVIGYWSI